MKKPILLILALILALSATALAHPGRTDENGGHYDHQSGGYHYHHGYEAHQHTGGSCPYDFDDKTGENSGSSSFGDSSSSDTGTNPPSSEDDDSAWNIFWRVLNLILITPSVLFFGFLFFVLPILVPILRVIGKRNEKWRGYAQKTRTEIAYECGMPKEFYIDSKDLPHKNGSDLYSDPLTVHMELHRRRYHSKPSCTYSPTTPVNVTQLYCCWACPKCRPPRLDLSWYDSYMNIREAMHRRGIEPVAEYNQLLSKYASMTRNEIAKSCGMPDGFYIDGNDLVHEQNFEGSLDRCTVYVTSYGSVYHRHQHCGEHYLYPHNIVQVRHLNACRYCAPDRFDLQWYDSYLDALRLMQKHGIEPIPEPDVESRLPK